MLYRLFRRYEIKDLPCLEGKTIINWRQLSFSLLRQNLIEMFKNSTKKLEVFQQKKGSFEKKSILQIKPSSPGVLSPFTPLVHGNLKFNSDEDLYKKHLNSQNKLDSHYFIRTGKSINIRNFKDRNHQIQQCHSPCEYNRPSLSLISISDCSKAIFICSSHLESISAAAA